MVGATVGGARPLRGLYTYIWDAAERGPAAFAGDLAAMELNTVCLSACYHAGKFIRPHASGGVTFFPEDGSVHCRTTPERYGVIAPIENSIVADGDQFGMFCEAGSFDVVAWTVLFHNAALGMRHPEFVTRNAFGDPCWYSLCPSHAEARRYALTLCSDIADRYAIRGLSIESPGWLPNAHGYHHEFALMAPNAWLDLHLSLCFCAACLAESTKAGIDAKRLRRETVRKVRGYLADKVDGSGAQAQRWIEADLVCDPDLTAYLRWRCSVVSELVGEIRQACRKDVELSVIPSIQRASVAGWLEGSDLNALAAEADCVDVCLYEAGWREALASLRDVLRRTDGSARIRCVLRPGYPDFVDEGDFTRAVHEIAAAGVSEFAFYNYGHLRRANLDWIGGALRSLPGGSA